MSQKPQSQKPESKPTSSPKPESQTAPETNAAVAAANEIPPFIGAPVATKVDRWPNRLRKSTCANPVKTTWAIAEQMTSADPSVRRKDVIAKAIEAGVAGYTARTQYQEWLKIRRESQRSVAEAAAKAAGQK